MPENCVLHIRSLAGLAWTLRVKQLPEGSAPGCPTIMFVS